MAEQTGNNQEIYDKFLEEVGEAHEDTDNNYQHNTNRLDGYKRWDVGGLIEGKFVYANRYAVTLGYSRGFLSAGCPLDCGEYLGICAEIEIGGERL